MIFPSRTHPVLLLGAQQAACRAHAVSAGEGTVLREQRMSGTAPVHELHQIAF